MSADLDSSTNPRAGDTASGSETSTATDDSGWDNYPDSASSEAGNTPEIAHLNQGNPDSPNGWGDYDPTDYDQYDDQDDDWGETATGYNEEPDPWGDTYPDAAYPADSSNDTGRVDTEETVQSDDPAADRGTDNSQPDQAPADAADSEHSPTPEQERISALETENADVKQQLVDARQEVADARQEIADLKANFGTRLDRLERGEKDKSGTDDEAHQLQA